MVDRRIRMLGDLVLADSVGLEIGALHTPVVRSDESHVLYVDYATAETLRANFRHDGDPADVLEVDIVWGDRPLLHCVGRTVDYVVGSNVIEHVPDLIGWFQEIHAVLKPRGVLGLAIPDCRVTFDVRRPVSLPGEMVEAYLRRHRQPSLRQVFDTAAMSKDVADPEDWRAGQSLSGLPAEVLRRLAPARDMVAALVDAPAYIDAHCWVFTPASFLDTVEALHRMGYFAFVVEAIHDTEPGAIEFQVRLRAVADCEDIGIAKSFADRRAEIAATLPEPEVETLRRSLAQLAAENAGLQESIAVIHRSQSWRVTEPLRRVMRLIRG